MLLVGKEFEEHFGAASLLVNGFNFFGDNEELETSLHNISSELWSHSFTTNSIVEMISLTQLKLVGCWS